MPKDEEDTDCGLRSRPRVLPVGWLQLGRSGGKEYHRKPHLLEVQCFCGNGGKCGINKRAEKSALSFCCRLRSPELEILYHRWSAFVKRKNVEKIHKIFSPKMVNFVHFDEWNCLTFSPFGIIIVSRGEGKRNFTQADNSSLESVGVGPTNKLTKGRE